MRKPHPSPRIGLGSTVFNWPSMQDCKRQNRSWVDGLENLKAKGLLVYQDEKSPMLWTALARCFLSSLPHAVQEYRVELRHQLGGRSCTQEHMAEAMLFWDEQTRCFGSKTDATYSRLETGQHTILPTDLLQISTVFAEKCQPLTRVTAKNKDTFSPCCQPDEFLKRVLNPPLDCARHLLPSAPPERDEILACLDIAMDSVVSAGELLETSSTEERESEMGRKRSRPLNTKEPRLTIERRAAKMIHDQIAGSSRRLGMRPGTIRIIGMPDQDFTVDPRDGDSYVWIIDPLDGARTYAAGIPFYCTAVGVGKWQNGELTPVCAAVYAPPTRELFVGVAGQGAVEISLGRQTARSLACDGEFQPKRSTIITHLPTASARLPMTERFILQILYPLSEEMQRVLFLGSGNLGICLVAARPRIAGFLNINTNPWNVFPGRVILESVTGGRPSLTDFSGAAWSLKSRSVVAAATLEAQRFLLNQTRTM